MLQKKIQIKTILSGHNIIFKEQAKNYREALPFGNGKFGGLVYRPSYWEWVVGKLDVDVDIHKNYERDKDAAVFVSNVKKVAASAPYSKILEAVRRKDSERLQELKKIENNKWLSEQILVKSSPKERPIGNLINLVPAFLRIHTAGGRCESFMERLDLYRGVITARCRDNGKSYALKTICDPGNDIFAITANAINKDLPFEKIVLNRPYHHVLEGVRQFDSADDCIWLDYKFANHFRYVVMVQIKGARFKVETSGEETAAILEKSCCNLRIYVTCATCLEAEDPVQRCKELISKTSRKEMEKVNGKRWEEYWNKSAIKIDDDFMENLYYFHQYTSACTHGKGMKAKYKASGLYGLWPHVDHIMWMNRVYGDVNIEMAYQHLFSSNHLEYFEAFVDMVWSFLPAARELAKRVYGLPGACFDNGWHCIGPWYCVLLWDGYSHGKDEVYLKEKAYPVMKDVAEFYAAFLKKGKDGKYYMFGSAPPERGSFADESGGETIGFKGHYKNVTIDLAFLKHLFRHLIETSHILGIDKDLTAKWREILDNFPEYPTGVTKYGETIFDMDEYKSPLMCHHPNTLATIYPTREFHFSSPKKDAALGSATVKSCWDNLSMYYTFNAPWSAVAMARMGFGEEAENILSKWVVDVYTDFAGFLGREIGNYYTSCESLVFGYNPGNPPLLEVGCGLITAVNEMLVQEQDNTLFVFPALPSKWKDASFRNLRIPGAFLVSGELHEGAATHISIESEKGGKLKVFDPWKNRKIKLDFKHGETIALEPKGKGANTTDRSEWRSKPAKRPKEKISTQGYRLFLGKDARSRIIEAVDRFCFPTMRNIRMKGTVYEGPEHRRFLEKPQNLFFKFDFGAKTIPAYTTCFNSPRDGNVPFTQVTDKIKYSTLKRFGWKDAEGIQCVKCRGYDPLSKTALAGKRKNTFLLRLNEGQYQFLLLHGNGKAIRTRITFTDLGSSFCFDAPDDRVGIEGFGINAVTDQLVEMEIDAVSGYSWQINAIFVKKLW